MVVFYGGTDVYREDLDSFGGSSSPRDGKNRWNFLLYLALPAFILSLLVHPSLNSDLLSDISWTFSMYLESVAILPQLFMFQKRANSGNNQSSSQGPESTTIPMPTAHIITSLGFARLLELTFWLFSYHELSSSSGGKSPGYTALASQVFHLLLMGDFVWYYFKAVGKGKGEMSLPVHAFGEEV